MSNAIGGQVKVTLTLNDAGFTMKCREAGDQVKGLGTKLNTLGKTTDGLETKLGTLGKNVTMSTNNLKGLQSSAQMLERQFRQTQSSMTGFNESAAMAASNAGLLNGVVLKLAALLDGATANTKRTAASTRDLSAAQKEAAGTTGLMVNGLTQQERLMRNLGAAHMAAARDVVLSASMRKNATATAAAAEIAANNRTITSKRAALDGIMRAERDYTRTLTLERNKQADLQARVDSRRGVNGRMMGANSPEMAALRRELELQNQKVAAAQRGLTILGQEGNKLREILGLMNQQNVRLNTRIGVEERIEAALARQTQRAREYLEAQRQQSIRQKQALEDTKAQMDMIKGMGELYAGMKIAQGEKASVSAASQFQNTQLRARAAGLTDKQMEQFNYMTAIDSANNPGIDRNEAGVARLAAMGGLAKPDQGFINQTLDAAIKTAMNVQSITGGHSSESTENIIRNVYGVVEARQQQYDPEASKKTFDLITRMTAATGGKLDIPDLETLLRRIGASASQITDDGIINLVSYMDQAKVSGGSGGGGGGAISTVGTMVKMLQAYANGKTMSKSAQQNFADAGVLNMDGVDRSANQKTQAKQLKNAGLLNNQLANEDPVKWAEGIAAAAMGAITRPENRKKYFGDSDTSDPLAQRAALTKWATQLGFTTTATNFLVTASDPRTQERSKAQSKMVKGSLSNEELTEVRMKTYDQSVKNFDAALNNLKITLGTTVLPLLTDFFNWITKIATKIDTFADNNKFAAEMVMIGGAVGGVILTLSGFAKLLGLTAIIKGFFVPLAQGAAATGILSRAIASITPLLRSFVGFFVAGPIVAMTSAIARAGGALAGSLLGPLTSVLAKFTAFLGIRAIFAGIWASVASVGARIAGVVAGIGARFIALGGTLAVAARVLGAVFLRMIPFVGWLYTAWELGSLAMNIKVGFASIGDWIGHWFTQLLITGQEWAVKFRNLFRFGDESNAEGQKRLKELAAEKAADDAFFANLQETNKKVEEEKKRTGEEQAKIREEADAKMRADLGLDKDGKYIPRPEDLHPVPARAINDLGAIDLPKGEEKKKREPRDQFIRSLAEITKNAEVTAMKISAAIRNTSDSLGEQARVEFMEKWRAGDFDPGHDASKRPFKDANGNLDMGNSQAQEWLATRERMLQQEEQLKALTYANERVAAAREDANTAQERGIDTTAKDTREMSGLQRELARTEERLRNGTKEFEAWAAKKNEALFERSRADLGNFTSDFADGDRTAQRSMVYSSKDRIGAEYDQTAQKDLETYNARLETMVKNFKLAREAAVQLEVSGLITKEESTAKLKTLDDEFNAARTKAETEFTSHVKVQAEARAYAMRGAIEKMQQDWENAYDKIDEVGAQWGQSFISNLATVLSGGEVSWREMLANMLKDVLEMQLKQTFAKPMSEALDGLTGWIKGSLATTPAGAAGQAAPGLMSGVGTALSGAGNAVKGGISSAASFFGLDKLAAATAATTDSVKGLATDGAQAATKGLVDSAAQTALSTAADATGTLTMQTFITAVAAATSALYAMAASQTGSSAGSLLSSLGSMAASAYSGYSGSATAATGVTSGTGTGYGLGQSVTPETFSFANGGIMSNLGSLPLKKYANGGIADSPQLALFGEGKYREAYVPLPDGRSIPVTFSGDNASGSKASGGDTIAPITISIVVNNDGSEETTESGDSKQQWTELATKVKGLIREQLIIETRPNGMLDKQK